MTAAKPKPEALSTGARVSGETVGTLAKRMEAADLERQQTRSDLAGHEDICAERYKGILAYQVKVDRTLEAMNNRLGTISDAQVASAAVAAAALNNARPKWWVNPVFTLAAVLLAGTIGVFGWMGGRLVADNDKAIAAAQGHAAQTVTVNPAQPAPIPVSPPQPAPPSEVIPSTN